MLLSVRDCINIVRELISWRLLTVSDCITDYANNIHRILPLNKHQSWIYLFCLCVIFFAPLNSQCVFISFFYLQRIPESLLTKSKHKSNKLICFELNIVIIVIMFAYNCAAMQSYYFITFNRIIHYTVAILFLPIKQYLSKIVANIFSQYRYTDFMKLYRHVVLVYLRGKVGNSLRIMTDKTLWKY